MADVVRPFLDDPRIRLLRQPNGGVCRARNTAARNARAPFLVVLDSDDRLRSDYLTQIDAAFQRDPGLGLVGVDPIEFDDDSGAFLEQLSGGDPPLARTPPDGVLETLLGTPFLYHGATFKADTFNAIGGYDTGLAMMEDLDIWIRAAASGAGVRLLAEPLYQYRVRSGSAARQVVDPMRMSVWARIVLQKAQADLELTGRERAAARGRERLLSSFIEDSRRRSAHREGVPREATQAAWRAFKFQPSIRRFVVFGALRMRLPLGNRFFDDTASNGGDSRERAAGGLRARRSGNARDK